MLRSRRPRPGEPLTLQRGAAQIALVGPPNVGKSSLLQALSEIQIKTGDYAFTTLRPVPATVLITPSGLMRRTRWLPRSATNRFPEESNARP